MPEAYRCDLDLQSLFDNPSASDIISRGIVGFSKSQIEPRTASHHRRATGAIGMRGIIGAGFEVTMIRDLVAFARNQADGYQAAPPNQTETEEPSR
jgi:hypothetical protein